MLEGFFQHYLRLYRPMINSLNEILSPYNLSYSLWQVIYYIKQNGPTPLVDIAKRYNVEKPSITRRVNALEKLKLIEKKESRDRREKIIQLTPLGEEIYSSCRKNITEFERTFLGNLSENELQQFFQTLSKLQQQFNSKEGKQR